MEEKEDSSVLTMPAFKYQTKEGCKELLKNKTKGQKYSKTKKVSPKDEIKGYFKFENQIISQNKSLGLDPFVNELDFSNRQEQDTFHRLSLV